MKKLILGLAALLAMIAFSTTSLTAEESKSGTEKPAKCAAGKCESGKCGQGKCASGKCGGK